MSRAHPLLIRTRLPVVPGSPSPASPHSRHSALPPLPDNIFSVGGPGSHSSPSSTTSPACRSSPNSATAPLPTPGLPPFIPRLSRGSPKPVSRPAGTPRSPRGPDLRDRHQGHLRLSFALLRDPKIPPRYINKKVPLSATPKYIWYSTPAPARPKPGAAAAVGQRAGKRGYEAGAEEEREEGEGEGKGRSRNRRSTNGRSPRRSGSGRSLAGFHGEPDEPADRLVPTASLCPASRR